MRCPFCSSLDTKVTDSRDTDDGASIREGGSVYLVIVGLQPMKLLNKHHYA